MADDPPVKADGMSADVFSPERKIAPQPSPTSPRIKGLLARAMMTPAEMTAIEVQEMAASRNSSGISALTVGAHW